MGPAETTPAAAFPVLDPVIVDDEMQNAYEDADMEFLDPARLQMSSGPAGQEFDDLLARATSSRALNDADSTCLSPSEMSTKQRGTDSENLRQPRVMSADSPAESPDNSSRSSSSESPRNNFRHPSVASSASAIQSEGAMMPFGYTSEDWTNPDLESVKEEPLFGLDSSSLQPMNNGFPSMTGDLESSNKAMDAAFDFESAASSPSPLKTDATLPQPRLQKRYKSQMRNSTNSARKSMSPISRSDLSFFNNNVKDQSPFSSSSKTPASQWDGQSPSSLLEESFGGINMNSGSPMNFAQNNFPLGVNFSQSPPQNNLKPDSLQHHVLTVHPTSLKSRVETQIPIRLSLFPLPMGVKKVRLPSHTISKPKFLAPPDTEGSPDTLELRTSLVCTSAMQDQHKLQRAFARARGETGSKFPGANDDLHEEDTPLGGGEVKICAGCIQRERKRASRKKQRKPEEDELFQKDEEKRVIVFNTNELKEWTEASKNSTPTFSDVPPPAIPAGAMQVELPMRIACYCRHQNEKLGFQVIFTLKDWVGNVIAQAITNSIMITDDHKTHAPPAASASGSSSALADAASVNQSPFQQSSSATDLQGLQQRVNSQYKANSGSFTIPRNTPGGSTGSQTPRNLSRQASPNDFQGPTTKRRKHSSSGRLPSELTMTRLESPQSSSSQLPSARSYNSPSERPFVSPSAMPGQFANGPPTPNGNESNPFFNQGGQQSALDNLVQQQLMSAPNSTHPSRPGSPGNAMRNSLQDQNLNILGPSPTSSMWPPLTSAGNRLPSVIHKLVPAEGSITGGTEVTLLGSGFYPGMEVVFGDTLATTTTFWGDKCLNCLTPPALQPGLVAVVFKHEHPTFGQMPPAQPLMPKQQQFFRYVDDRELQMYRLALGILGQKLGSQADAFHTAQQIMGSDPWAFFNLHKDSQNGSGGGNQRQVPGLESQGQLTELDSKMLTYLEFVDLDDSPRPPKYSARCGTGQTLLHFASSLGLTRFVAGLLARGANPEVQDNTGNTPMHLAALNGHAHIVHRLRLAGANANARSIRGFTSADLASTLPAHQAALLPSRHYRSRSVGSLTSLRHRRSSSASIHSLWEASSGSSSFDYAVEDSDSSEEDDDSDLEIDVMSSRRSSVHQDIPPPITPEATASAGDARPFSPPAALVAWRNQLQAQINQFQQSVSNAFPNLPALPALPDYQAHPMMRRITNLVPNRPTASWPTRDGWWDLLKGNTPAPGTTELPSYDELYPRREGAAEDEEASQVKKTSLMRAATETLVDHHFEAQSSRSQTAPVLEDKEDLKDIRIGRNIISREQQKHLRQQQAQRMKGLGSDRNLYFIWIPLLLLVICAWARNYAPDIWHGISSGYEFVKTRYTQGALEAGV